MSDFKVGDRVQFKDVRDDCERPQTRDHTYTVARISQDGVHLSDVGFYFPYRFKLAEPTPVATPALARASDPATSKEAAKTVNVTYLEGKVLTAIQAAGEAGATQDELVDALQLPSNSITPRFKPLMNKGVIFDRGATRPGHRSGKRQRVMFAPKTTEVQVVIAESKDRIVREVDAERQRREDFDAMKGHIAAAHTALHAASRIATKRGFEILEHIAGETKLFNPSKGVWQQPPEAT